MVAERSQPAPKACIHPDQQREAAAYLKKA